MKTKNRQQLLTVAAIVVVGLFAADKLLLSPLGRVWTARSKQLGELRTKVQDGTQLARREQNLRSRWRRMQTNSLPNSPSLAEQQVVGAFDRWSRESRISITSISPQSKHDAEDYSTLQCRVEAAGNLSALSQFLYAIEKDPMALRLEIIELSARDNEGQQLALGLQVSGLILTPHEKRP